MLYILDLSSLEHPILPHTAVHLPNWHILPEKKGRLIRIVSPTICQQKAYISTVSRHKSVDNGNYYQFEYSTKLMREGKQKSTKSVKIPMNTGKKWKLHYM